MSKGEDIDVQNYDAIDQPFFYQACRQNDAETAKRLIKEAEKESSGAGTNLASFWGEGSGEGRKLPIHEACEAGSNEVVKVLLPYISQEVLLANADEDMLAPIHYACKAGSKATVAVLLERLGPEALEAKGGIRLSEDDSGEDQLLGMTAVHWAFVSGASEVVHLILSHQTCAWGYTGGYIAPAADGDDKYPGIGSKNKVAAIKTAPDSFSLSLSSLSDATTPKVSPPDGEESVKLTRTASSIAEIGHLRNQVKEAVLLNVTRRHTSRALATRCKEAESRLELAEREKRRVLHEIDRKRDDFVQTEWNADEVTRLEGVVSHLSARIESFLQEQVESKAAFKVLKETQLGDERSSATLRATQDRLENDLSAARVRIVTTDEKVQELRGMLKSEIQGVGEAQKATSVWRMKHRKLRTELEAVTGGNSPASKKEKAFVPQPHKPHESIGGKQRPTSAASRTTKKIRSLEQPLSATRRPGSATSQKRTMIPSSWRVRSLGLEALPVNPEARAQANWEAKRLAETASGGEWDFAETLQISATNLRLVGTTRAN